jgi:hypothetical protein
LAYVVNLDLLFQSPKKNTRSIRGKGEEENSKGSTMVVKNMLKNPIKLLGKNPLLYPRENITAGGRSGSFFRAAWQTGPNRARDQAAWRESRSDRAA